MVSTQDIIGFFLGIHHCVKGLELDITEILSFLFTTFINEPVSQIHSMLFSVFPYHLISEPSR